MIESMLEFERLFLIAFTIFTGSSAIFCAYVTGGFDRRNKEPRRDFEEALQAAKEWEQMYFNAKERAQEWERMYRELKGDLQALDEALKDVTLSEKFKN